MGKPGKNTRKFAKKHLKSVIEKRRKTKPLREAWKRKKAAAQDLHSGTRKGTAESKRKDADDTTLKMETENMVEDDFMDSTSIEDNSSVDDDVSISDDLLSEDENTFFDILPREYEADNSEDEDDADNALRGQNKFLQSEVDKHMKKLQRLKEKDPNFVKFLKKHEKEYLQFNDDDEIDPEEKETFDEGDLRPNRLEENNQNFVKPSLKKVLTAAQVDAWCQQIKEKQDIGAVRCLLQAFQTACHYGDGEKYDSSSHIGITTSNIFNKIVMFVLCEMDNLFRKLLGLPAFGGKREAVLEMEDTAQWRNIGGLIKSYFANTLYLLNQLTDNQTISFTLQRLRCSIIFLAAFPRYIHKFLKVALHFWGSGGESLCAASFLFIRDATIQLGSDCLDSCLKRIYKVFAANCKLVNATNYQQVQFLKSCVVELYGVDLANAIKHVSVFIQQLRMVLQRALTLNTKEAHKKAYSWQYMNCVDLWVKFICAYTKHIDLQSLSSAMAEIIIGISRLVSTARYAPLRLQCVKTLNTLASARGIFIPVASVLFNVLESKDLEKMPTGGAGKVCDFSTILKVSKPVLKTRAFQEECVYSALYYIAEHLAQWSYDVVYPELAFISLVHLQRFHDKSNIDKFRRQVKQLMDQVQRNIEYVTKKREEVSFSPKDHAAVSSFLQAEKEKGASPLSKFYVNLQQKADLRKASLQKDSVHVQGEKSANLINGTPHTSLDDGDIKEIREAFNKHCSHDKLNKTTVLNSKKQGKFHSLVSSSFKEEVLDVSSNGYDGNNTNYTKEHDGEGQTLSEGSESKNNTKKARLSKATKTVSKCKMSGKLKQL